MQKVNKTLTFGLEKRIKERKKTYGGSPSANQDQIAQVWNNGFNLELQDQIVVIFTQKGGGIYRKSGTVRIVLSNIVPWSRAYMCPVDKFSELDSWLFIGWKGIAPWSNERPDSALNAKSSVRHPHAARLTFGQNSRGPPEPVWSAHTLKNDSFGPCCVFKPFPTLLRPVKPTLRP